MDRVILESFMVIKKNLWLFIITSPISFAFSGNASGFLKAFPKCIREPISRQIFPQKYAEKRCYEFLQKLHNVPPSEDLSSEFNEICGYMIDYKIGSMLKARVKMHYQVFTIVRNVQQIINREKTPEISADDWNLLYHCTEVPYYNGIAGVDDFGTLIKKYNKDNATVETPEIPEGD